MARRLQAYTHQVEFVDGDASFSVLTSYTKGQDLFEVRTDTGAVCSLRHTSTTLTIYGVDERGRNVTVRLAGEGEDVRGELQVAGNLFHASEVATKTMPSLLAQVSAAGISRESLPKSLALTRLARKMRAEHKLVSLLVGHGKLAAARKTYCESVCACCEKASWFSPWCCISCGSCDYFEVPLANKFEMLVG